MMLNEAYSIVSKYDISICVILWLCEFKNVKMQTEKR